MTIDQPRQIRSLVTGATGYVGARLVPRLLEAGHAVRALARTPAKLDDVPWRDRVEVARGDLSDLDSLVAAFDGVDVVYYLVHSMGSSKDFGTEETRSARNVVEAARSCGVRRLVYLSGLHPEGRKLSPHLESRRAVGEVLIESGIETVVLQAGVVIGSGSASFEMIRHLTDRLPVMTTPKWVHNKIQPISVHDVLYYLTASATADVPSSRAWDVGGPDVLEYGDMMRIYAELAGLRKRYLVVLPFLTPAIASLWIGTVTPLPPGLARPLIESLECDAVMRNSEIDSVIEPPPDGLTGYRESVSLALRRPAEGPPRADWASLGPRPAELLPSDPDWAGEIVHTMTWTRVTDAPAEELLTAAEKAADGRGRWRVAERKSDGLLLRSSRESPGEAWLELAVAPEPGGGSRYTQRAVFVPTGIVGRAYRFLMRPVHTVALSALAREVIRSAAVTPRTSAATRAP